MANLLELHQQSYPDMPLDEFARRVHAKSYSDMPFEVFAQKVGLADAGQTPDNMGFGERGDREALTMEQVGREEGFAQDMYNSKPRFAEVPVERVMPQRMMPKMMPQGMPGEGVSDMMPSLDMAPEADMPVLTREQLGTMRVQTNAPGLDAFSRGALDAASFGFMDEAAGALVGDRAQGQQRGLMDAAEVANPRALMAGQFAGALAMPGGAVRIGATRLANAVRMGAASGAQSGLYGAGSGETADERLQGGLTSAAIGAGLGAGLGALVPGTRAAAGRPPRTPTAGQEAAAASNRQGVPLPKGIASDSKVTQTITQGLSAVPIIGGKVKQAAQETVDAFGNVLSGITKRLGDGTLEGSGSAAQKGLNEGLAKLEAKGTKLYERVEKAIPADAKFKLSQTERVAQEIDAGRANAALGDSDATRVVKEALAKSANGGMNFAGIKFLRTELGKLKAASPSDGELKQIYGALTSDMEGAAKAVGGQASKAWNTANNFWRGLKKRQESLARVADTERASEAQAATRLGDMAKNGKGSLDTKTLAVARRTMSKESWKQVTSGVVAKLGQREGQEGISLNSFATDWAKLDNKAKGILFDKQELSALEDLASVAKQWKIGNADRNFSNTAGVSKMAGLLTGGAGGYGLAVDPMSTLAAALSSAAISYPLAKLLSKPATARAFKQWALPSMRQANSRVARRGAFVLANEIARANNLSGAAEVKLRSSLIGSNPAVADDQQQ